jgi:hypothetical protein
MSVQQEEALSVALSQVLVVLLVELSQASATRRGAPYLALEAPSAELSAAPLVAREL